MPDIGVLDLPRGDPIPGFQSVPAPRLSVPQADLVYAASGGTVVQSSALVSQMVRLATAPSGTAVGVRFWIGPTNKPPGSFLAAGAIEYFRCYPGEFVWAVSQDVNTGTLFITECGSKTNT